MKPTRLLTAILCAGVIVIYLIVLIEYRDKIHGLNLTNVLFIIYLVCRSIVIDMRKFFDMHDEDMNDLKNNRNE